MTCRARLALLLRHLRSGNVDSTKFDMGYWEHCALGEAARVPELAADGLRLIETTTGLRQGETAPWVQPGEPAEYTAAYNDQTGYTAVAAFFGMSVATARECFGHAKGATAQQVAQKIRARMEI